MKNLAIILAALVGVLANTANAESAVSEAPLLTLAMNDNAVSWVEQAAVINIDTDSRANELELTVSKSMEQLNNDLDKKLEAKLTKEIEYAMQ
jgi:hypothetical protein